MSPHLDPEEPGDTRGRDLSNVRKEEVPAQSKLPRHDSRNGRQDQDEDNAEINWKTTDGKQYTENQTRRYWQDLLHMISPLFVLTLTQPPPPDSATACAASEDCTGSPKLEFCVLETFSGVGINALHSLRTK
jgi:hypothetical protein